MSVVGTKRLSMKIIDDKDRIKVDPSSVPLYGKAWKQTGQVGINGLPQGSGSGSEKKLYRKLVLMKNGWT
jgi:hypothetical protein